MKKLFTAFLPLLFLISSKSYSNSSNHEKLEMIKNLNRIAFGSCNKQFKKQLVWKDLMKTSPDLFIWGGDNIYADTKNPDKILKLYEYQNEVHDYQFFKTFTPIIGTWDDHDYGLNNQNGHYPLKKISRHYALNFFEEPPLSPRRLREGIYTSYDFGEGLQRVKIILLDNRYFKDLDKRAPLLGKTQWEWLENEIKNSKASLHLIVSGLSVLSPANFRMEEWADYPSEKLRLKNLLQSRPIPYLYLTGDKHFSAFLKKDDEFEFMSSGLTHTTFPLFRPVVQMNYPKAILRKNYGLIDFEWDENRPVLKLTIRDIVGRRDASVKKITWKNLTWHEI